LPGAVEPGVSQKNDFPPPSPPVSIMAPEEPAPREATAPESNDAVPQPLTRSESPVQSAPVTPIPPRRPPQVRAPRLPPAAPPQLPPVELRGTPLRHPQSAPNICFALATFSRISPADLVR
jgi:hypothetical protein